MFKAVLNRLDNLDNQAQELAALDGGPGLGTVVGEFLLLRGLRGFWPFSSTDNSGAVYDLSGQGRVLTNTNAAVGVLANGLPYGIFNGTTSQLSRADEAGLDITGALTFGGWFYLNDLNTRAIISKAAAAPNFGFQMAVITGTNKLRAQVSGNGTAITEFDSTATLAPATWQFLAARFTPSTEMASFVNASKTTYTTAIPAAIANTTASFIIGANGAGSFLNGFSALNFLCAYNLSDATLARLYRHTRGLFGV